MKDPSARAPTSDAAFETWLRAVARSRPDELPAEAPRLPAGTLVGRGRFRIESLIGRGGMGVVYEAVDLERGVHVALKTLRIAQFDRLLAFKQEFRALQGFHHPNLVQLGELYEDGGRWLFTMERVIGEPFTHYVRAGGLQPARIRGALLQLVEGLRALHRGGKVHRDVKPSNTLIEASGRLVLLDFGLIASTGPAPDPLWRGAGTAAYMAPEQRAGGQGPAADFYAVGVMLYEALTGVLPFGDDTRELLARKRVEPARPPSAIARGVPPDLEALCLALLEADPAVRPSGTAIAMCLREQGPALIARPGESDAARSSHPFVGRAAEQERIADALSCARESGPMTLLIRGESGVGKSSLLERCNGRLASYAELLSGRCHEHEFVPFKALDGVMDALARRLSRMSEAERVPLLPPRLNALARIFPVFDAPVFQGPAPAAPLPADPLAVHRQALAALRELLARLAERGPLVLIIDDWQWADADSVTALEQLFAGERPPRLLLLLAARPHVPLPSFPGSVALMELAPLAQQDAIELARSWLGQVSSGNAHAASAERLAEDAGGHPLFIETLVRHLGTAPQPSAGGGLEGALSGALSALQPSARELVEIVSAAVQPMSHALLAHASQLDGERLRGLLRGLHSDHLLLSRPNGSGVGTAVEIYHDRIREAAARAMGPERAAQCHLRLAQALEVHAPERSEALAVHWHAAGKPARAHGHALRAARNARQALAFDRAAELYRWAIELQPDATVGRATQHRWLAEALVHAGRARDAARAYRDAAKHADTNERWDLERCAAEQLLRAGHIDEGLAAFDGLLPPLGMVRPKHVVGTLALLLRESTAEACTRLLPPAGGPASVEALRQVDACWAVGVGLAQIDPVAGAVFQVRYRRLAHRLGERTRIALGLALQAPIVAAAGPPAERAQQLLDRARALMHGTNDARVEAFHVMATANVRFILGDYDGAIVHGERAEQLLRDPRIGASWELATATRIVLDALWHTGRLLELKKRTAETLRDAAERADAYCAVQVETTVLPIVHLMNDDPGAASAVLDRTLAGWSRLTSLQHWQRRQLRTLVELYAGDAAAAHRVMETKIGGMDWLLLSRIKVVRAFSDFVAANVAIGLAARAPTPRRIRAARRRVRRLAALHVAPEAVALFSGQLALLCDQRQLAAQQFAQAQTLYAGRRMQLLATIAQFARGCALGVEGEAHVADARRWLAAQQLRSPAGFVRMLAPALASEASRAEERHQSGQ